MIFSRLTTLFLVFSLAFSTMATARSAPESFAPLVEKLIPAVVNISTTQKLKTKAGEPGGAVPFMFQLPEDPQFDPFRQFFDELEKNRGGVEAPEREVTSLGSGFVIDSSGYVVTNNHVIAEADEVSVIFSDDTSLKAEIVGRDPKTDLALLKVESDKPLSYVTFGDSDKSRVGDWIVAIGNPFGLGGTVTAGIISARSRSITAGPFEDFLQTDAAINRGNSGGPLFNLRGEVVGINTAIFSPSGGNVGIGFAVPSAIAKPILGQLRQHGRTYRGWLGVKIQEVTPEIASAVGLDKADGALVLEITENSPAAKSTLKSGDVIIAFDGQPVTAMKKLPRIVADTKIGKSVEVEFWREGKRLSTKVVLGELDEGNSLAQIEPKKTKSEIPQQVKTKMVAGVEFATIDTVLRRKFRLPDQMSGVLIVDIKQGSKAAKQNIRVGDIVVQVNGADVETLESLEKALAKARAAGRDYALVKLLRDKSELFTTLPSN